MENYPDILLSEESDEVLVKKVVSIKGMAEKSAKMFVEKIDAFTNFIKEIGLEHKLDASSAYSGFGAVDKTHPLFGKSIVMSGFRDSTIQDTLKTVGAKLSTSVSKNTFLVLVKDKEDDTGKIADAKKLGIVLMTPNEFKEKYMT
jgi:NAD-dependent DNA ligase